MGPGNHTQYNPHCLRRDFSPSLFSRSLNQSILDYTWTASDHWHLETYIEAPSLDAADVTTHGGGHLGVGGQIGEVCTALHCLTRDCVYSGMYVLTCRACR